MLKTFQDLSAFGITPAKIEYNLSYEEMFRLESDASLTGLHRAVVTELGSVNVDTGKFTGRSPEDKYIVEEPGSKNNVWWSDGKSSGSDNKPISEKTWDYLNKITVGELIGKDLYVMDGFCGANKDTRLSIRLVTDVAWMAHFFKNMFIRPTEEELLEFKPDWTILSAPDAKVDAFKEHNLHSEVYIAFHIGKRMTVIGGTWYGGEIKKGIFSIMNYFLPLQGIGSFHCSANMGEKGDTALFFGLSGTGKTTLSTDPKRKLIGDDEHGWDDDGIFNFEGGCYAKCIDLTKEREPEIFAAIRRDSLLENCDVDEKGHINFASKTKTENTRVSYPMYHIRNIVAPISKGGHPKKIIFLTCDAYGVFPPVAKLTKEQAMYHYLSGYTAKVAGTELGVTEPKATFSACFGKAFLLLHPTVYAEILGRKMDQHQTQSYLLNTGWVGGKYGVGKRISLKDNRASIDAIFDGSLDQGTFQLMPVFDLNVPRFIKGVESNLMPRNAWANQEDYDETLKKLAQEFVNNFKNFTGTVQGKGLEAFGPKI